MTPNELDAFLKVLRDNKVGAAALVVNGATVNVTFVLDVPEFKSEAPEPGGWKSPNHLDNPMSLDPAALRGREYQEGQLP